ncbi:MAG TPA: hypothetical protein VHV83_16705, partial [Armatimonadota bacterium]|nr:hypothetical protein [Armatimonadota bacterium]
RQKMVREARWLVTTCGFDGIQWDYEVCRNNDRRFLALLKETKHALPKSFISVCTPLCLPSPISRYYGWSEDYFVQVAAHCDQLAVMAYDSGIYLPRGYAWLLKEQTIHVTHAAGTSSSCRVIIGVPTYDEGGPSHHAHAENLRTALLGVNAACADQRLPRRVFDGVAIFADYTTSVREWHEYNDLWLRQTRH